MIKSDSLTEDQAAEFWWFMVSQNLFLYGRERNHESQFHGFALNRVLEFTVSRCRHRQRQKSVFAETLHIMKMCFITLPPCPPIQK
jgi:hypothetical protein